MIQQITRQTTQYGEVFITESNDGFWLGILAYFIIYGVPIITIAFMSSLYLSFIESLKR